MPENLSSRPQSNSPGREQHCWYALETRPRYEKHVVNQLSRTGIETFLPQRSELHCWSDRKKRVTVPLFAGYVFVRLNHSRDDRLKVLQTAGVVGIVSAFGEPLPVPSEQLEHLRRLLEQNVTCSLHAFLETGQRVRVRGGVLDGIEGTLVDRGTRSLVLSIDCLQRSLSVRIEGYELELA